MGQAKNRLKQKQSEQPWCVYCGGASPGLELDHMPPMAVFDLRQRYGDMVYLACKACHTGTRPLDQFAGFLCRVFPGPTTPETQAESAKIIGGIANNFPGLLKDMEPTPRQRELARELGGQLNDGGSGALNISDKAHALMVRFAARVAFALHYELCRQVLPESGGVLVRWFTNEVISNDGFLRDLARLLGPSQSLRQGSKSLEGQFEYRSNATEDMRMSAHIATFRLSFGIEAYAARDIKDLAPPVATSTHNRLFRPGFLQAL
jgi:hypothetical protein